MCYCNLVPRVSHPGGKMRDPGNEVGAIALKKGNKILKVLLKIDAMETSHNLLRKCFSALTPTLPAHLKNKI